MEYKTDLKGLFLFELKSWLGRNFISNKPKLKDEENYLNLGCGNNYVDGYINADFYRFKFWKKYINKREWQLDLRDPLNCDDNIFDGIFTEHTLEHLYPDDVANLLAELYRVLKPDSIIRITVPDLEKYVGFYNKNYENIDVDKFKERYQTGCSAIRNTTQNYFHFSAWDFNELKKYLEDVGFKNVKRKEFSITQDSKLNLDLKDRSWETLYLEARK
jgi:predicted SAM-dependent methyltransferase